MSERFDNIVHAQAYEREFLKSAVLHYPPEWITLGICSPCASKCDFCAYHSVDGRKKSKVFNVKFLMPTQMAFDLVDFFHHGGVPKIHVCATGEPMYHPDFFPILDHVIRRFGKVTFQSNFPQNLVEKRDAIAQILARKESITSITVDLMDNPHIKGGSFGQLYEYLTELAVENGPRITGNFLLTRLNWRDLEKVVRHIHARKLYISIRAALVFPHGFNPFTDARNAWARGTVLPEEEKGLEEIVKLAKSLGVRLFIPDIDSPGKCDVFWKKLQIWPTRESEPGRLDNLVPHGCNAVVLGDMESLGYVRDFPDIFTLWNNEKLVRIRKNLLAGKYPDRHCANCPNHAKKHEIETDEKS